MTESDWFKNFPAEFEESVRIDRDNQSGSDPREQAIESYHVTSDSRTFLEDFIDRLLGESEDMRTGSNYWLYGYYGSGKSHLLTVLDGLMDSEWIQARIETVCSDLVSGQPSDKVSSGLCERLESVHSECHVIPVSVNLLKYQGQRQRSFSEIVLRHAHQSPDLTGVGDGVSAGLSSQTDVAYFEDWYRTTDGWDDRRKRSKAVVDPETSEPRLYDWERDGIWADVQEYSALADVVLPKLFEEQTGTRDGYTDIQPSNVDPEEAVRRLESLRDARDREFDKPVKLVLLLDEVSLFIGTDFDRLTELQTLAENVNDIGGGNIQLVATAQANIEDVQPRFAAHGADFSIVKDRFPHRHQLPSKHVGDIAKQRLFQKSSAGQTEIKRILDDARVKPEESLVYRNIKQNKQPPLNEIDSDSVVDFYPFLPYHAPLFLDILSELRQDSDDPAKSIFSGTARAILAVMNSLLEEWVDSDSKDHVISLVDFFDLIERELREILPQDMRVIEGTDQTVGIADELDNNSSDIVEFDLDVAKAVLLLRNVHEAVPLSEDNIAVAVMSDLNGRSQTNTANRVRESLDRLQKFIRPVEEEGKPGYRFATQEERLIYNNAEENELNYEWDSVISALDEHLWDQIIEELSLPESVPYKDFGEEYPVSYSFEFDGTSFEASVESEDGLDVEIAVTGLRPDSPDGTGKDTLYWRIGTEGLQDLRERLIDWWALRNAVAMHDAPPAVRGDLEEHAAAVRSKIISALMNGSYRVKDKEGISGLSSAVKEAVDSRYPDDFHPVMLQVDADRLLELRELGADSPLPAWAQQIQVPSSDPRTDQGGKTIQRNVMSLVGRQLKGQDDGLNMETVLAKVVEQKPFYDECRPALCAIIWGFCRDGRLLPMDETGNTLANEKVLDVDSLSNLRLKLLPRNNLGDLLEDGGFKETTDTVADGLINLQEANDDIRSRLDGIRESVVLAADTDIQTDEVAGLLRAFADELTGRIDEVDSRISAVKSQGSEIETAIRETNEAQEWIEEASGVWDRRRLRLYEIDAILAVGVGRFNWMNESASSSVESCSESVSSFDAAWWTTDGWSDFSGELVRNPSFITELEQSWRGFVGDQELEDLIGEIKEHPWVIPATELPTGVHSNLEREYIRPARGLQRWYETFERFIEVLSDDSDVNELVDVAEDIRRTDPLVDAVGYSISEVGSRLDELSSVVKNRTPDEVDQAGLVPGDRQKLDRRLETLVEEDDLEAQDVGEGVVIK